MGVPEASVLLTLQFVFERLLALRDRSLIAFGPELALGVLSYNLKRVINIVGVPALLQAM